MSSRLDALHHSNGIEEDPGGAYVYHDDVEPIIAEITAKWHACCEEVQRLTEGWQECRIELAAARSKP